MEVKWTCGPWTVEPFDENGGYDSIYPGIDINRDGSAILTVDGCCYGAKSWELEENPSVRERMIANAQLIAAAPDLYDALERLLKANERLGEFSDDLHATEAWDGVVSQAIAALSKARGET